MAGVESSFHPGHEQVLLRRIVKEIELYCRTGAELCGIILDMRNSMHKTNRADQLPFSIDRTRRDSLTDQLVAGFSSAIRCGIYRRGDQLPTLAEIARLAGVSQIVVRNAVGRLADTGLVVARQFHGIEVLGAGTPPRKGHVLIVTSERRDNYFTASVSAVLRETLTKAGYITTPVSAVRMGENTKAMDFSQLDAMLDLPIAMVIVLFDRWGIGGHIVSLGKAPVVIFGSKPVPGAAGFIRFSCSLALTDFAAHCAARGVGRVTEVVVGPNGSPIAVAALGSVGVACEVWKIPSADAEDAIEMVQRGTLEAFERRLANGTDWLPDLLFFPDDYAAAGALTSLAHYGVRIPDDVRLVTSTHTGNGPFYWEPLTRIEFDPHVAGRSVANFVLLALAGKSIPPEATIRANYHVGATFP